MRHLNGLGTRPKRKPITTRKMRHIGKASIYYDEVRANGFTQVDVIRSTHNVEAVEASFYGPMAKINASQYITLKEKE